MMSLREIWHDDAEHLSSTSPVKKSLILKIQDAPVLHHHEMMQIFRLFKIAAVRRLEIFKLLTAVHVKDTFCVIVLDRDIARFLSVNVKFPIKSRLIWHRPIGLTLPNLEIIEQNLAFFS